MVGAASASLTAFGAWPGVTAKVVEGVKAMSRLAAAATRVCERQCAGGEKGPAVDGVHGVLL